MPELRIDPLSGQRAIVAGARAGRPGGELSASPAPALDPESDPFAEGHEDRTPPEVFAVRPNGGAPDSPGWTVRVVPSLYPALAPDAGDPAPEANHDLFDARPARGAHEVVVNAPEPVVSLGLLRAEQVAAAMEVWRARMRHHREAGAACVHLIVNERREAGASLPHTHAQVYALDFVPAPIARERERFGAYATQTMGGNLLADLVQEEVRRRERIVAIGADTVVMAPYGSRVPYQMLIAPRSARMRALIQRVSQASVSVEDRVVASIGPGLLVLLGVSRTDTERDADWLARKVLALRVFPDAEGKMNEPLGAREILCVSQFTLYA